ncbi:hypothetical protein A9Q84_10340 [Halobacteriovorax marinus]|uniref:Thioredoxin domain-containing protein n=1 Tax=Halobacteriovorax marinus TaxID=97084 RepID=A0A1Y5F9C9_9BACT|nr:hypothetical protein A9Q84_10340 [Halobacteriovorax marinus]
MNLGHAQQMLGKVAPEFETFKWYDSSHQIMSPIYLKDFKGKVIYLHFFQSWCPGCLTEGLPMIKKLSEQYKLDNKVKLLAVQTVFEGFSINNESKLRKIRRQFDLEIPMAHDDGGSGNTRGSLLMKKYHTRGTPWVVIISPKGKIIYTNFHIKFKQATELINFYKRRAK